jgi:hypothetical protein
MSFLDTVKDFGSSLVANYANPGTVVGFGCGFLASEVIYDQWVINLFSKGSWPQTIAHVAVDALGITSTMAYGAALYNDAVSE